MTPGTGGPGSAQTPAPAPPAAAGPSLPAAVGGVLSDLMGQLLEDEGERLKPYRDTVGKLTIGVGRNLDDMGISHDEALYLLRNDVEKVLGQLAEGLPWWPTLDEARQGVLANMAFQLGYAGLMQFHQTLSFIEEHEYRKAAEAMRGSKWYLQVPKRAERLATIMEGAS